jgi:hypothetical protein
VGSVFLDIEKMTNDMRDKMIENIDAADVVIVICSERMKARGDDKSTNVHLELSEAVKKKKKKIIPLLYQGGPDESIPDVIKAFIFDMIDMRNNYDEVFAKELIEKVFVLPAERLDSFDNIHSRL